MTKVTCLGLRSSFVFGEMALSGFTWSPTSTQCKWLAGWLQSGKDQLDACTQSHPSLSLSLRDPEDGTPLAWADSMARRPRGSLCRHSLPSSSWVCPGTHQHPRGPHAGRCLTLTEAPHFQSPGVHCPSALLFSE